MSTVNDTTMDKRILSTLFSVLLLSAQAKAAPYISASVGAGLAGNQEPATIIKYDYDNLDNGIALNGALGYGFEQFRAEIAIGYQKHEYSGFEFQGIYGEISNHEVSYLTVMANGYYDFDTGSDIIPYLMGGIGIASPDATSNWVQDDTAFAWQIGAGLGARVSDEVVLDLEHRYLRPEGLKDNFGVDIDWESHNIMAGIRYGF